jgi:hypothetical protein
MALGDASRHRVLRAFSALSRAESAPDRRSPMPRSRSGRRGPGGGISRRSHAEWLRVAPGSARCPLARRGDSPQVPSCRGHAASGRHVFFRCVAGNVGSWDVPCPVRFPVPPQPRTIGCGRRDSNPQSLGLTLLPPGTRQPDAKRRTRVSRTRSARGRAGVCEATGIKSVHRVRFMERRPPSPSQTHHTLDFEMAGSAERARRLAWAKQRPAPCAWRSDQLGRLANQSALAAVRKPLP